MLCKNPAVQEKVAKEVREATEGKQITNFAEFAASVDEEALEKMNYLHAAITETLDSIQLCPWMKFIWGDDAEEYKPERWLNEDGMFRQRSPFKFTAFQAGPRLCLGKEFAYRQMKIFSAVLIGCFVFKLRDEKKTVNYRTMINLRIDGGLHVCALHR
ncbi:hypothetical protein GH714_019471 [Hevea brasiliensis]|uniref:Cytochrome P450 n=1 Tax=Hevea brasiliensis TaxID=3981 RepID=A0A6A6MF12_HEVBR|nr:hypothetical protein GH714_019471 [Hevea brasiliensis]